MIKLRVQVFNPENRSLRLSKFFDREVKPNSGEHLWVEGDYALKVDNVAHDLSTPDLVVANCKVSEEVINFLSLERGWNRT